MPPTSRGPALKLFRQSILPLTPHSSRIPLRRPFICAQCSSRLSTKPIPAPRPFSTSSIHLKKSKPSKKSPTTTSSTSTSTSRTPTTKSSSENDPHDHSELSTSITTIITRLQENLTTARDAGRVSVSMLESLAVELPPSSSNTTLTSNPAKTKTTISALASIVPQGGRTMLIYPSTTAHIKPIFSAILASPYSLTPSLPSPSDTNQLLITVPVPPITAETRSQAASEAKKVAEKAGLEVRNARGEAQKRLRGMELSKSVVADELRKAKKGMEEVAKRGQEEVKRVLEGALRGLER